MTRVAAAIAGLFIGWYLGYRQGYFDGQESSQLFPDVAVRLEEGR